MAKNHFIEYTTCYSEKELRNKRCEICGIKFKKENHYNSIRLNCFKCHYYLLFPSNYYYSNYEIKNFSLKNIICRDLIWDSNQYKIWNSNPDNLNVFIFIIKANMNNIIEKMTANTIQEIIRKTSNYLLLK